MGLHEGAGGPVSILKIKKGMSNGGMERAERRMEPGDGGVALRAGVGRMVKWREGRKEGVG